MVIATTILVKGDHITSIVPGEVRIVSDLLKHYGQQPGAANARPVMDSHDTLNVNFSLVLIQILDFDEMNQKLNTLVWKKMSWIDPNLRWNPVDYEGVTTVSLPSSQIWTPDIILFNTVRSHKLETDQKSVKVSVTNTGKVLWIPPVKYQSSCVVNMEEYPFDEQECKMSFGSWMYDHTQIDINFIDDKDELELHNYHESTEWKLTSSKAVKKLIKYPCCEHPFVDMTYTIRTSRIMTLHMRLFLVPTPMLAVLALGIFWIPPKMGARTSYGLAMFKSFFALLILVKKSTPASRTNSIEDFFMMVLKIISGAIVLSILTINILKTTRTMPKWVEKWLLGPFGWLVTCRNSCDTWCNEDDSQRSKVPNAAKWRQLALAFDRLCFLGFIPIMAYAFGQLFPNPNELFRVVLSNEA